MIGSGDPERLLISFGAEQFRVEQEYLFTAPWRCLSLPSFSPFSSCDFLLLFTVVHMDDAH